jgi:hypothetical protein
MPSARSRSRYAATSGETNSSVAGLELGDPPPGAADLVGSAAEALVDLGDRGGELVRRRRQQFSDAGQRHPRVGQGLHLDQLDRVLGVVRR